MYETGRVYEGHWAADKRHGKGYERFSNGNQYLGDFDQGRVTGRGIYSWVSGESYEGGW